MILMMAKIAPGFLCNFYCDLPRSFLLSKIQEFPLYRLYYNRLPVEIVWKRQIIWLN